MDKDELLQKITLILSTYDYLTLKAVYRTILSLKKKGEKHDERETKRKDH